MSDIIEQTQMEQDVKTRTMVFQMFKSGDDISISIIQRRFALGYNASWRVMDALLSEKFVTPNEKQIGIAKVS